MEQWKTENFSNSSPKQKNLNTWIHQIMFVELRMLSLSVDILPQPKEKKFFYQGKKELIIRLIKDIFTAAHAVTWECIFETVLTDSVHIYDKWKLSSERLTWFASESWLTKLLG